MGSCVSVTRDSESAMKLKLSYGSKTDKLAIPPSPVKENRHQLPNGDRTLGQMVLKSKWSPPRAVSSFRDYGSKEETFFDSKTMLESDCEDDFYSVNGDFTPSRGNTPVHHKFPMGTPRVNKDLSEHKTPGASSTASPTEKRKKLADLFRDSIRDGDGDAHSTPYLSVANSVCSSERTANEDPIIEKDKAMRSMQCCLPSLVACRSFSERKKKMSPAAPAIAVNDES